VPEARIAMAHGQLKARELERAMTGFVARRYDVLLCTTIIESGLDIPNVNTIIVDRADTFGLAQLYQIRGRVGRSSRRAYAYLMVPPESAMTEEARRRLSVLQRFSELGSGFQIASYDLEIRGAGNLLGPEQSGHIARVGMDMYLQLMDEAVAELRGQSRPRRPDPEMNIDVAHGIPESYLADTGQRLVLYKRLASCHEESEVDEMAEEIADRYGPPPADVGRLLAVMRLRPLLGRLGVVAMELAGPTLALTFGEDPPLSSARIAALVGRPRSPFFLSEEMQLGIDLTRCAAGGQDALEDDDLRLEMARNVLLELLSYATGRA
jgi:transcription-repair coupling factor (superfamily II helicase)